MPNSLSTWEAYRDAELAWALPKLRALGYELEDAQLHMGGERFLMQAVTTTSGPKLILLVRRADGTRAVAKATSDSHGTKELVHERICRERLALLRFAYVRFLAPRELYFKTEHCHTLSIQEFIDQPGPFLGRSTPEQFTLALAAFKTQEGAHAATYEQEQSITKTFGVMEPWEYLSCFKKFRHAIASYDEGPTFSALLDEAEAFLMAHEGILRQYGGFLTHTDFVPHNFRVVDDRLYLLDASALRFGNKYEGWARFVNFMELYNSELARVLVEYVANNRTPEESTALRAMRIYRLGEIMAYYVGTLSRSEGDLRALNEARVRFWASVLRAVLNGTQPTSEAVAEYTSLRDRLRSPEEKLRQKNLH